jgi:hypothetical protein
VPRYVFIKFVIQLRMNLRYDAFSPYFFELLVYMSCYGY